jgi:hypothetical protein
MLRRLTIYRYLDTVNPLLALPQALSGGRVANSQRGHAHGFQLPACPREGQAAGLPGSISRPASRPLIGW